MEATELQDTASPTHISSSRAGVTEELQLEGTGLTKDQEGSPVSTEDDRRETTAEGREVRPQEGLNKYGGPR